MIITEMPGEISHYPCPACSSVNTTAVMQVKDYTVSGEMFTIHHCNDCTLRFTFPIPDEQHIPAYYKSESYISHTDTNAGIINKIYHLIRKFSLKQKKQWIENATGLHAGNILDIGCGTGAFLHMMKQAGWITTGLEPDEQARKIATVKYHISPLSSEELYHLPLHSFHAITLWHVLEHVHDLHTYLEQIHQLLHPQGKLFLAIPNYTSLDAEKYKNYWAAYDVPRQLYHFSPTAFI
jgi:2-polyprenyl-3-methyl-5-hydroxy-6-metoxy-1,4-benzoquinol methylase